MSARIGIPLAIVLAVALLAGCGGGGFGDNEGILSFTALDFSVREDGTVLNPITVQRLGGTAAITVTVMLTDGTATAPDDYDPTPITLSWAAGDLTPKTFTVPIVDDHLDEPNETVHMALVSPTGGAIIRHPLGDATLTIIDNDVAGQIGFGSPAYTYGEDGTALGLAVMVVRTGGKDGPVSATITSTDGTANSDPNSPDQPVDYLPVNVTVSWADQDMTPRTIPISIVQDVLPEQDEDFTLHVSNLAGGATPGFDTTTVTILDDDFMLEIPAPGFGGGFGATVAKLGSRLVVGAPGNGSGAGAAYVIDPATGAVTDTITRPFSSGLGSALAKDGGALAIAGAGNVWVVDATTHADRFVLSSTLGGFGNAMIGLGDGRLAIGAPSATIAGAAMAGAVRIYDEVSGALLQPIDGGAGDQLGAAFALFGTDLVVGAPGSNGAVLRYAGTPLAQTFAFANPFPESPSPGFGRALATAGTSLYVGAPDSDAGAINGGAVTLITPTGNAAASQPVANARFGTSLFFNGVKLYIYAPNQGPSGAGRVHVYDQNFFFNYLAIDDPSPNAGAGFGTAMCEFNGSLVIGAPHQNVPGQPGGGAVFLYRLN